MKCNLTAWFALANFGFTAAALGLSTNYNVVPGIPSFSVDYLDRSVTPGQDFYRFAAGNWSKNNPVPADKARWASFSELAERNWYLIHEILDDPTNLTAPVHSPRREVGDFFASAMDTNRIERLGFQPIADDLKRIDELKSTKELFALLADFHRQGFLQCQNHACHRISSPSRKRKKEFDSCKSTQISRSN